MEKLTSPQLVKNFPAFYGTRRFITAFTTARHMSKGVMSLQLGRFTRHTLSETSLHIFCSTLRGTAF